MQSCMCKGVRQSRTSLSRGHYLCDVSAKIYVLEDKMLLTFITSSDYEQSVP